MKQVFTICVVVFQFFHAHSQNVHQQAYWVRLFGRLKLNEKLTIQAETDYRRFMNPDRLWQEYSQLRMHYRFHKNWEIVGGVGYAVVWQGSLPVPEWRPYEDIQYFHPLSNGWQLAYRVRVEERFIHNSSKTELTEGFGFRIRPRFRVQVSKAFASTWTMRLSEEVLFHTDDGFNQNQVWLSVERQFKNGFSIDLGYMKAIVKRNPSGYIDRDNLRLSFIKNFTIKHA